MIALAALLAALFVGLVLLNLFGHYLPCRRYEQ